jgi:anthranilate synthase/aminodeoxychorismate synthase-like glutamine amidotransferase
MTPRVLLVDNRDSFVFNLADEFRCLGAEVRTIRSGVSVAQMAQGCESFAPDLVVLSPGPGRPEEAGVMVPWLRTRPRVPVLGICLGHQAIAVAAGGRVGRAPRPVHGRASAVHLRADPIFAGLATPMMAARYHSLVVTAAPDELEIIATASEGGAELIMALRHRGLPQWGLQFHPESILTPQGSRIVARVLEEALSKGGRT